MTDEWNLLDGCPNDDCDVPSPGTGDALRPRMLNVTRIGALANIACGVWLMLSALLFRHSPAHAVNALVVGGLVVAFGLLALRRPMLEAANVALGLWLFASTWALPGGTAGLVAHHFLVATLLFGFAAPVMAARDELEAPARPRPLR